MPFQIATSTIDNDQAPFAPRRAGEPITFSGCAGFLHHGNGSVGVLMVPPWGLEDFTVRQGWRDLAQGVAAADFPCLRFDLPGTGDSLGDHTSIQSLDPWLQAIRDAATTLRASPGIEEIVILGQGLGGLLAQAVARDIGASAMILMAPQAPGRSGLRELEILGPIVASTLRIAMELDPTDGLNVGGFRMAKPLTEALRLFKPERTGARQPIPKALVLVRPDRAADTTLAETLRQEGTDVTLSVFDGYHAYVTFQATPQIPYAAFAQVIDWLDQRFPARRKAVDQPSSAPASTPKLSGDGFVEQPVCFGPERWLFGMLCLPADHLSDTVVLMVNSGFNPHIGWARGHVQLARNLARRGIASLRMDTGALGDSDRDPAEDADLIYSAAQIADIGHGVDVLDEQALGPVVLTGRCSGAYAALLTADADRRVAGVVAINSLRLIWRPGETLEQALSQGSGSLANYGQRALSRDTLVRLLTFKLPVWRLAGRLLAKLGGKLAARVAPLAGELLEAGRLRANVIRRFIQLGERHVEVALVYAEGDGGLDELALYCGPAGQALAGMPNVSITVVPDADHNMTPALAQAAVLETLATLTARIQTKR